MDNRMTKSGSEQTWARIGHSDPHTGTLSRIQPHRLELSLASSRASLLVVAGPGFEPG